MLRRSQLGHQQGMLAAMGHLHARRTRSASWWTMICRTIDAAGKRTRYSRLPCLPGLEEGLALPSTSVSGLLLLLTWRRHNGEYAFVRDCPC